MARIRPRHAASLVQLLSTQRRKEMRGAEVGVLSGECSQALLEHLPELYLWMVDSWSPASPSSAYYASQDGVARLSQTDHLLNMQSALERTMFAADRRVLVRGNSTVAAQGSTDQSFDFVFIDADHTLEAVRQDIAA